MEAKIRYARTSDGVDIAYAVRGEGPPLLFARPVLRPAVDNEIEWQANVTLTQLARTRGVVIWDYRGSGMSGGVDPEYTLDSSLADMKAVADGLNLERFDLMGQLTPAHTAIAFAARHPERVRRLVLWNAGEPGASPRGTTLAGLPDIATSHFPAYVQLAALRLFGWDDAESAKRWERGILAQFTAETWTRVMEHVEAIDATGELSAVHARTLVVLDSSGTDTRMPPLRRQHMQRLAATLPDAELRVLSKGGATPADVIEEFLAEGEAAVTSSVPHGTAIILFADIVDSTALTERLGDAAFRDKARELDDALRAIISERGGKAIDGFLSGDGVLATFPAASQAIDAALKCGAAGDAQGLPLHLGLHAGDVIREQNNVFGGAVNIASRISGLSAPGEVLVSDIVRGLARTSAGVTFEDRGEQSLKGIGEPVRVFAVRREGG